MLACLKSKKKDLQSLCRSAVTQRQIDAAEDIALDPVVNAACSRDRERLCADAGWVRRRVCDCLCVCV